MLEDMAILTCGKVVSEEVGRKLDSVLVTDLGRACKVVANKDNIPFVEGKGTDKDIKGPLQADKGPVFGSNRWLVFPIACTEWHCYTHRIPGAPSASHRSCCLDPLE